MYKLPLILITTHVHVISNTLEIEKAKILVTESLMVKFYDVKVLRVYVYKRLYYLLL